MKRWLPAPLLSAALLALWLLLNQSLAAGHVLLGTLAALVRAAADRAAAAGSGRACAVRARRCG